MIVAQYEKRGPVPEDVIYAHEIAEPPLAEGQVLVAVLAAPINPSDILTLTGEYGQLPPLPARAGNEGVGKVVKLGSQVDSSLMGQTVLLPVGIGTWASHLVCKAKTLIPLPNEADPRQLSMMTVNPPTALLMLEGFVDLKKGDWVIQNAANSGVGSYLIQLAKLKGFKTINVVRRQSAVAGIKEIGGDEVLVDGPELAQQVASIVGNDGVMLGIDAVGGSATGRLADSLSPGGTLVNYGSMSGEPSKISAQALIFRDITLKGFWLAKWFRDASSEQQMATFGQITQYIAQGTLFTKIHAQYSVNDIKQAVKAACQGERDGKILIVPDARV